MSYYNIFDTQAEAETAETVDFTSWKATKPQESATYWSTTTHWAVPFCRVTDNKWVYPVCSKGSQDHTQELFDSSWCNPVQQ